MNNSAWLDYMAGLMGGVSRQTHAATFAPDRFYCLLDELPLHLVPRHARAALALDEGPGDFHLNPDCSIGPADDIPEEFASERELLAGFALQGTIAWVRDPASGALLPFWLGSEFEGVVQKLRSGQVAPSSPPAGAGSLLTAAGILIRAGSVAQRTLEREEVIQKARSLFRERGYSPLSNLIHPFHIAALRRYYRYLIRKGKIQLGDGQSSLRYAVHNDPVARFFHKQIVRTLSMLSGEKLKPSYVYLASYLGGADLKKHTDREQCEFSITLCLDFSPEPELATPWPIRLDTTHGTVVVHQALGDGLAYRGTKLPHYRAVLGPGQTSTSIFFHYVREDFDGSLM
jgi:hypothetical protein